MKLFNFILSFLIGLGERGEINAHKDEPGGDPGQEPGGDPGETGGEEEREGGAGDEAEEGEGESGTRQPGAVPQRKDPTEGMTLERQVSYWKKKYGSIYEGYDRLKKERRGDTGLAAKASEQKPAETRESPTMAGDNGKPIETIGELTESILKQAEQNFEKRFTEKQLDGRVASTEEQARKQHDGSDGYPDYDAIFDGYVEPMIKQNPKVYELLRLMPNPAEAAYTLGFLLKYPNFKGQIESAARDGVVNNINKTAKQAATVRGKNGGVRVSTKLTADDIDKMTPADFEKELEKFKADHP